MKSTDDIASVDEAVEHLGLSFTRRWKCKKAQALWETVWWFLIKSNVSLPYIPAIPIQNHYPREMKTSVHKDSCTGVQSSSVCDAPNRKQPTCLSTVEMGEYIVYSCTTMEKSGFPCTS